MSRWIALAGAAGSDAGRALLPAWLELEPARFPEVRDRVLADCGDDGEDGPARRAALVRGLRRVGSARGPAVLARAAPGRVADGFGRIVGIDLATGRVTHDLRT